MTAIISADHGTVFHYSIHFGSILSRLLTLLISRPISNISFIQLSSLLLGYPASSSLEEAPVNLPQTIRLGEDSWKKFFTLASREIVSCEPLELFMSYALAHFSGTLYQTVW